MNDNYKHLLTQIARPSYDPGRTAKLSAALDNRLANFRRLKDEKNTKDPRSVRQTINGKKNESARRHSI